MRHSEYEQRRRALEEQYLADAELLRAAYQAKLRALEMLWLVSPDVSVLPSRSPRLLSGETPALPVQSPAPALPPPPPPLPRGQFLAELVAALPSLPEVFDCEDIERALGYKPSRPTLNRAFSILREAQRIVVEVAGHASRPTSYRKLPVPPAALTGS
jgi:hypothetical protein